VAGRGAQVERRSSWLVVVDDDVKGLWDKVGLEEIVGGVVALKLPGKEPLCRLVLPRRGTGFWGTRG
jgi:hypothetical protein